ncbi:hypothetical protein ACIQYL_01125 [Lysinibacillus xylanilyticus]|uniref:hypothetical protein n=1 Tax=Lysinibacillus xylanilyticus TaxID=582475 RepID=UPI0037F80304
MKSRYFLGGREFFGETTLIHFPKSSAIFGNSVAVHIQNDITQASTVGETQSTIRAGILGKNNLTEIGQFILGNAKGRTSDEEFTIFDCTGIALQDLAVSKYIVSKAEEMNVGTNVQI